MERGQDRLDTDAMTSSLSLPRPRTEADRLAGALLGLAVGDAVAASVATARLRAVVFDEPEPDQLRERLRNEPMPLATDVTALAWAVTRAYLDGWSEERVLRHVLDWYEDVAREIQPMAEAVVALGLTARTADACLVRALPTALVRADDERRRREAADVCRITHPDERSVQACVAYADLLHQLLAGATAPEIAAIPEPVPGDVGSTLGVVVWAAGRDRPFADVLLDVAVLTAGRSVPTAAAGGLLGGRDGLAAIPRPWLAGLAYGPRLLGAVPSLVQLRHGGRGAALRARTGQGSKR